MQFKLVLAVGALAPMIFALPATQDCTARNLNTIQRIYNTTVYPNNVPIVYNGASAVPPGLFSNNTRGRVSPVGNFTSYDDSIEYFFGLAPLPQNNSAGVAIYEADIVEFTSGCCEVASSVVYLRTGKVDPTIGALIPSSLTSTLKQVAFWRFDSNGLVTLYDAWIPNLQKWAAIEIGVDPSSLTVQALASTELCPTIQQRCTGSNQQYSSTAACIAQLELKPFGDFDEVWGDNLVCRTIHLLLTLVRPEVHCPHVGPNGGAAPNNYKCVNIDYSYYYFDDLQLFGVAEPFKCPATSGWTNSSR